MKKILTVDKRVGEEGVGVGEEVGAGAGVGEEVGAGVKDVEVLNVEVDEGVGAGA